MVFEFSNSLWWMLPRALRRLHFSLAIWGQWKRKCSGDSALWQQLLSVIIIFEFLFSQMANSKFKPCNEFKLSDFIRTGSKMFHSMIVGGKSVFFLKKKKEKRKLKFVFRRRMLFIFLVKYWCFWKESNWKDIEHVCLTFSVPMPNLEGLQT